MVTFTDIIETIKKDEMMAGLVANATGEDALNTLGFDSLDVMMITYNIEQDFNVEVNITTNTTVNEIVELINTRLAVK